MELDFELFYWLQENGILTQEEPSYSKYKSVSTPIARKFLSGFVLSKILKSIENQESDINTNKQLEQVKDTLTGIEIIQNWNILFSSLENDFLIMLDEKMKHLIINQDKNMIGELFNIVYETYGKTDEKFQKKLKEIRQEFEENKILEDNINKIDRGSLAVIGSEDDLIKEENRRLYLTGVESTRNSLNVTLKFDSKQLEPINFQNLSANTPLDRIEKVTEFILVAFARQVNRTPMEVAMLLTERSKYFYNIIVCGKEGDFKFIIRFLEQIYTFVEKLVKLCLTDTTRQTLRIFLNFLKCGLVSRNEDVAKWTCNILTSIGYLLDCMSELEPAYKIFIKDIKVLKVVILGMKRHPILKPDYLEVITCFGKDNIKDLIQTEIRKYLPSGHGFYQFTHEFLLELMRNRVTMKYLEEGEVLKGWIEEAIEDIKLNSQLSINTNIYALNLLVDIWIKFDDSIERMAQESKQRIFENIESVIQEGKNKAHCLHISLITSVCQLYEHFWDSDPILVERIKFIFNEYICTYKKRKYTVIREHLVYNICNLVKKHSLDVSSFIRSLLNSYDEERNMMNNADFDLMRIIVMKDQLNDESTLYILDFLCKLFMSNFIFMGISAMFIVMILKKKRKRESFIQHSIKFVKVLFTWLYKQKSKFKNKQKSSTSRRKKEGALMVEKRLKILDLIQLIIQTEPTKRVSVYIKNLTGFLNFKLNGGSLTPGTIYEVQDVLRPIFRQYYDAAEMERVAEQYQGVFNHYFKTQNPDSKAMVHGVDDNEFNDMMHNQDILGEENHLNRQFMSMSSIMMSEEKQKLKKKRKKRKMKLRHTEKVLAEMRNGAKAFRKDVEYLRKVRREKEKRKEEEIEIENLKREKEKKWIKHSEKIVEKQRLLLGNSLVQNALAKLEDLTSGLNTIQENEKDLGISFIYCLKEEQDDEVKKSVEIWFEKWEFFLTEIFRFFAVKSMKAKVGKKIKLTTNKPELFKFVKMIHAQKVVTMAKISYIMQHINLKYKNIFCDQPLDYNTFRDFCINFGMVLWPAKIDEPVLVILDRLIDKYIWEVKMNQKYFLMRKYCKVSYKNVSRRFKDEKVFDDGSKVLTIEAVGYEKRNLEKGQIRLLGEESDFEKMENFMMCYEILNDVLQKEFGTSNMINKRVTSKFKVHRKAPLMRQLQQDNIFGKYYNKSLVRSEEDNIQNQVVDVIKDMVKKVELELEEADEKEFEKSPSIEKSKFRVSSNVHLNRIKRERLDKEKEERKRYIQSMKEFKKRGKKLKERLKSVKVKKKKKEPMTVDIYIRELDTRYKKAKKYWEQRKEEDMKRMADREQERRERERLRIEKMNSKLRMEKERRKKYEERMNQKLMESMELKTMNWKKKTKKRKINVHKNFAKTRRRYQQLQEFNESKRGEFEGKKNKLWDLIESKKFENLLKENKKKLTNLFQSYRKLHKNPLSVPANHLDFQAFYTFCMDFNIVPKNAKPKEVRNILVALEQFELKGPTKAYRYFDMEQFSEAIFIMAFAKVMLPHASKLAQGKISRMDNKRNSELLELDEVSVDLMKDFLEELRLSDNYREVDRRVQDIQMKKGAKVLRFMDSVVKDAEKRRKFEREREDKIMELNLKKRGRSGVSRRSRKEG